MSRVRRERTMLRPSRRVLRQPLLFASSFVERYPSVFDCHLTRRSPYRAKEDISEAALVLAEEIDGQGISIDFSSV